MDGEVVEDVEDDELALRAGWGELGLDPGIEGGAVGRGVESPRARPALVRAQAGDEGLGARMAEGGMVAHPLATAGAAAHPGHVGPGAAFVDEDQPVRCLAHPWLALGYPRLARRPDAPRSRSEAWSDFFVRQPGAVEQPRDRWRGCAPDPALPGAAASSSSVMSGTASTRPTRTST